MQVRARTRAASRCASATTRAGPSPSPTPCRRSSRRPSCARASRPTRPSSETAGRACGWASSASAAWATSRCNLRGPWAARSWRSRKATPRRRRLRSLARLPSCAARTRIRCQQQRGRLMSSSTRPRAWRAWTATSRSSNRGGSWLAWGCRRRTPPTRPRSTCSPLFCRRGLYREATWARLLTTRRCSPSQPLTASSPRWNS
mmetsp:Transcript_15726/g.49481  ORF Transcript_15726/g.49481 Transcript_15726/m.49481 type:complete len:202 (-) Transcript_15726:197-802(-)